MKKRQLLLAILILMLSCIAYAEDYDTDPSSVAEDKSSVSLEITGIIYDDTPVAIVNGEIVKEGDKIGDWKVEKIDENFVKFKHGDEVIIKYAKASKSSSDSKQVDLRQKVNYRKIKKLYFHISKGIRGVDGYIIFLDKDGDNCATSGRLSLGKKIMYYEKSLS